MNKKPSIIFQTDNPIYELELVSGLKLRISHDPPNVIKRFILSWILGIKFTNIRPKLKLLR